MKITILTAIYRRPHIVKMFLVGYECLREYISEYYPEVELSLVIVRSEGEKLPDYVNAVDHANFPLVNKFNRGALECMDSDYVIMIGSDDILSPSWFEVVYPRMKLGIDYIYSKDWYFYDTESKKCLYWAGYLQQNNRGDACGAGRVLSRSLMIQLDWKPWREGYDRVLDTGMDRNLEQCKYHEYGFFLREKGCMALDIKSDFNMTRFEKWMNSTFIDQKDISRFLDNRLTKIIFET